MNALGRRIYKGIRGGEYVLDARGKKVYKFKKAPEAARNSPARAIAKDSLGREIRKGPRGGLYVLNSYGKKLYKFAATASAKRLATGAAPPAAAPAPPAAGESPKNAVGRKIFKGPKGGEYVLDSRGKKIYKFKKPGGAAPAPVNENGFSAEIPKINLKKTTIEVPRIRFDASAFQKKYSDRKIDVYKAEADRSNVFVLRDTNVDALTPWFEKQANFINGLGMDDFLTLVAYANRSHTWIGPYLAMGKVKNLSGVSNSRGGSFVIPLFPQMKRIIDSLDRIPDINTVLRGDITPSAINQYDIFCNKTYSDKQRYDAYSKVYIYSYINERYVREAMDMYAKDLQSIILRSPPIEKSVFLYRGSRTMYMKLDGKHRIKSFSSASFTPAYPISYGTEGYHRIELRPGSHAVALAIVNPWNSTGEYEILLPMNIEYTPRYDRRVKRWVVSDTRGKQKTAYAISNFTVQTP
jgi:hypothetical protein